MSGRRAVVLLAMAVAAGLPVFLAGAAAAADPSGGRAAAPARASASSGGWGRAIEVPGLAGLNTGGGADFNSVSCAAAGDCSAGGDYRASGGREAFVVTQWNGRWGKAIEVPGLAALNKGGGAAVNSVSCAAAGDCSAGGLYDDGSHNNQAFVVTQRNGHWGKAIEVPGLAALNKGGVAQVFSVSCAAAGDCSAGGFYDDGSHNSQAFVVTERNGRWGKAIEVPGLAALSKGGIAVVRSVSCAAAGDCSAGGSYGPNSFNGQAFVATERNGRWGKAIEVPGLAALNKGRGAEVISVSCAAGRCSAGGDYLDGSRHRQAFVVTQRNGRWGTAIEVPGTAALNKGGIAQVSSVSCAAAGDCSAGGDYTDGRGNSQAFVVTERNGRWGKAIEVPGLAALNKGRHAEVISVSCGAAGDCSAGGVYLDGSFRFQAFVVTQANGRWGKAIEVPGTAALSKRGADLFSVSCAAAGDCSAGGSYTDGSGHTQAFVVSRT